MGPRRIDEGRYSFSEDADRAVDTYIVDSGVFTEHEDFGGRASIWPAGTDWTKQGPRTNYCGSQAEEWRRGLVDDTGHGTHV